VQATKVQRLKIYRCKHSLVGLILWGHVIWVADTMARRGLGLQLEETASRCGW